MKKKLVRIVLVVTSLLGLFLAGTLIPELGVRHYYFLIPWRYDKPNIYSMRLRFIDTTDEWQWRILVQDENVVQIDKLSGPEYDSWLNDYGFTIEDIFDAGRDFCFEIFECRIRIDSNYSYPEVLAYPPYGIIVEDFKACETLDECLQKK